MNKHLIELRHTLHRHPEVSGNEIDTAARIKQFILQYQPTEIIEKIGGTGLAVIYRFKNPGPCIAIRCELDALPIQEQNGFEHKSIIDGVSHKCGHDGHMTIVAGLAEWLQAKPIDKGTVILLFQPAEETGKGAEYMLTDKRLLDLEIEYMFALHNIPGENMHEILVMESSFSAEVISFKIQLIGKESHASEPEKGINPALALANLIHAFDNLVHEDETAANFRLLTPVFTKLGQQAYGISPASAELHYTIRTWSTKEMEELKKEILVTSKDIAERNQLEFDINWFEQFPASENNSQCNQFLKKAAASISANWKIKETPFRFGEDFGGFSKVYQTAMFGLGAGIHTPSLHDASYDFPDELIETGIGIFRAIIEEVMNS